MRYLKLFVLALTIMTVATSPCTAESLQIISTPQVTVAKRGQVVPVAVSLKNILMPREPITITAEAEWEDEYGVARTATANTTLNVIQPVKVNRYKVIIPALFDFVVGSAKVNGQPATPALEAARLTFELGRTLLEGELAILEYAVRAQ